MIKRDTAFSKAVPVWAKEKTDEINCSLWFETSIVSNAETILRIAGNNDYQVFINGVFCFYGPARAGRGYYRVDEIAIGEYLTKQENRIEILVSAYKLLYREYKILHDYFGKQNKVMERLRKSK